MKTERLCNIKDSFYDIQYRAYVGGVMVSNWRSIQVETEDEVKNFIDRWDTDELWEVSIKKVERFNSKTKVSRNSYHDSIQYSFWGENFHWSYKDAALSKKQYLKELAKNPDCIFYKSVKRPDLENLKK